MMQSLTPIAAKPIGGRPGVREAFGTQALSRDHAIDAQLKRLGARPEDVRYVIYSHLHLDHAGGMSYFPKAIHVIQRDEIRYALWPDAWTRPVYCQNDFKDIHKLDILEIEGDCDLFDDGTLRLLKTPEHAPGIRH
jgi:N-acyl homoserine lactone hydrolase